LAFGIGRGVVKAVRGGDVSADEHKIIKALKHKSTKTLILLYQERGKKDKMLRYLILNIKFFISC